jgi:soluble lytic murein transglycosylase-like protein
MKENFENLVATAATNRDELMGRSTKPKEIVALRLKRLATPPTEGEVLSPSKDQKPGRLDAWAMRTLMGGSLLLLLTFFSIRGLAQQMATPGPAEEAAQEVAPELAQEPSRAPAPVSALGPISALNPQRQPEIAYRPPEIVYYADAYADYYHVPRELVYAIITHESGWKPRVVSNKGAMGLMQLMPTTAAYYYVTNPFDIAQNIGGGVHYLADLIVRLGDWRLAVASYYCGPTYPQQRGLLYSNPEVVAYVAAIQRLYMRELFVRAKQAAAQVQHRVETTQSQIQADTPEVQP